MTSEKTWTRWHSDGWVLTVTRTDSGDYFYKVHQDGRGEAPPQPATRQVDAQHNPESHVRDSGHRCVARCSFWIPDPPDEE
jgi:hypothetical protein